MSSIQIIVGEKAKAWIRQQGLLPEHIRAIPGAAGGPKGLILQGLDHYLFSEWLNPAHLQQRMQQGIKPLQLIGASIGAWRMAAAASKNPSLALHRLAQQYIEAQNYAKAVTREEISQVCQSMLDHILGDQTAEITSPEGKELLVWVNKGLKPLHHGPNYTPRKAGFASAVLANSLNRNHLGRYFERWVFQTSNADTAWLSENFDRIPTRHDHLSQDNLRDALLASGSIPFVLNPVSKIARGPVMGLATKQTSQEAPHQGPFWDGGLTDYHLALPYHRLDGLVLYPHFASTVTPGWLDKFLKIRKARPDWMSNVILICPSPDFVSKLPAKKIPDRSDFKRYGTDHAKRIQFWKAAVAESERMAEDFSRWKDQANQGEI